MQACKPSGRVSRRKVPGRLVEDFSVQAHRFWKEPGKEEAPLEWEGPYDVVIAGAGVAGLSAAWRLRGGGVEALKLLEMEAQAGGTSQGGHNAVSAFPWGAHYIPAPLHTQGPVARLLREMGLEEGVEAGDIPRYAEMALVHEPQERVFAMGRWEEGLFPWGLAFERDKADYARFMSQMQHFSQQRDSLGLRAFDIPMAHSSQEPSWQALDTLSMAAWMRQQGFSSKLLLRYVDMACRDDYGCTLEETSAWAGIFYFAARARAGEHAPFLSWPEGNARLCRQFARSLSPGQLQTHMQVYKLLPADKAVDSALETPTPALWALWAWDLERQRPRGFLARQVVLALPQHVLKHVLWRHWLSAAQLAQFQQASWVVANLTLSRAPETRGSALAWDNVPWASPGLGYIHARHQSHAMAKGPTVLSWYFPLTGPQASRSWLEETDHAFWCQRLWEDLADAHPGLADSAEELLVRRWGHAMPKPVPGFLLGTARRAAQISPWENLHVAHSELSGLGLFEEACHHGVRVAEKVLKSLGRPCGTWI